MIANIVLVAILLVSSAASAQSCPEIRMQQGVWTETPLHQAIHDNDVNAVKGLMSALTVNKRDSFGDTPLVYALTPSEVLEPAGIVSASRKRALIAAESTARQAIVSALLSGGAAVNEPGARGVTPS